MQQTFSMIKAFIFKIDFKEAASLGFLEMISTLSGLIFLEYPLEKDLIKRKICWLIQNKVQKLSQNFKTMLLFIYLFIWCVLGL